MTTQTQTQDAGSETIRHFVNGAPSVTEVTDILKSVDEVAAKVPAKKSIFGKAKGHVSRNKGKYSFALGVGVGAAAGIGYSIWKVGGAPAADLIGDAPV